LLFRSMIYYFLPYFHIILNIKSFLKYCFHLSIINWSLQSKLLSQSLQMFVAGNQPSSHELLYRILLLHLFAFSIPSSTLRLFFYCSTNFFGFTLLIFIVFSIQFHHHHQYFYCGFILFFHLYHIILSFLFFLSSYRATSLATVITTFLIFSHLV